MVNVSTVFANGTGARARAFLRFAPSVAVAASDAPGGALSVAGPKAPVEETFTAFAAPPDDEARSTRSGAAPVTAMAAPMTEATTVPSVVVVTARSSITGGM